MLRLLSLALLLASLCACAATAPRPTPKVPDAARLDAEVERLLREAQVPGLALAVIADGRIVHLKAYGQRDREQSLPLQTDTVMYGASLTKTVFESALWLLFERDLSPGTPVVEIIPEFLGGTQPAITVGMVETHLGGFAFHELDYPDAISRQDSPAQASGITSCFDAIGNGGQGSASSRLP